MISIHDKRNQFMFKGFQLLLNNKLFDLIICIFKDVISSYLDELKVKFKKVPKCTILIIISYFMKITICSFVVI